MNISTIIVAIVLTILTGLTIGGVIYACEEQYERNKDNEEENKNTHDSKYVNNSNGNKHNS